MLRIRYFQSGGGGGSFTPSSPRASVSPIECSPSTSKSRLPSPAEKAQGPPPSPSPPNPFTPEVHETEGVKPTQKIKDLAGHTWLTQSYLLKK
ncbi:hypothetical protein PoB_005171400 [Plakobranchus ocellatus]|uniref:Uncharacterized protein n=1 Tax=Plakobranchus ocellatus TaxID=259542 RepID=A0AAV4C264_9GAST|nr:hypothetical protein PoB_005171400 [Plakobranchus ocellatus]